MSSMSNKVKAQKMSEIYQDDMVWKDTTRTSNYKDCPNVDIANKMTESRIITSRNSTRKGNAMSVSRRYALQEWNL